MKKLLLLLLCLVMAMSVALTSCGGGDNGDGNGDGGNGGDHTHAYGEWTTTTPATCYAKGAEERTCSCGAKENREIAALAHTGSAICEVCFTNLLAFDTVDTSAWDSLGIKLTDLEIVTDDDLTGGTATMDLFEVYVTLDEDGNLDGYGSGTISFTYVNIANHSTSLALTMFIEDNVAYMAIEGIAPMSESTLENTSYFKMNIEDMAEIRDAKATLEEAQPMIEKYLPIVEDWFENTLAPIFANVNLGEADKVCNLYLAKIANSLFVKNADGTVVSLSFDVLKTWNQTLADKSIAEVIDLIVGEGTFASVEALVADDKLYNFSVAELINYLETEQGIDLSALLAAIDTLVAALTETEGATLESIIPMLMPEAELPEGFDLDAFLEDETVLALSVKDAIFMALGEDAPLDDETTADVNEAVEAIKTALAGVLAPLKEMTVYDIFMNAGENDDDVVIGGGNDITPTSDTTDPKAAMVAQINAMIDTFGDYLTIDVNLEDGKATSYVIGITAVINDYEYDESYTMTVEVTVTKDKVTLVTEQDIDEVATSATMELIPGYKVTPDADKVAAIKAKLAGAETLMTKDTLKAGIEEEYSYEDYRILDDAANNRFVVVIVNTVYPSSDYIGFTHVAEVEVYFFGYTDYFAYSVTPGCGNIIRVSPVYNGKVGTAKVPTLNLYNAELVLAAMTLNNITDTVADENLENTSESFPFLYNPDATGDKYDFENNYENATYVGHNYQLDEAGTTDGDDCDTVYKNHYVCSVCQKAYDDFYVNGHNLIASGSDADSDKVYDITLDCAADGCDYAAESKGTLTFVDGTGSVTVDATPDFTEQIYESDAGAVIAFTYTPVANGEIMKFSFNDEGNFNRIIVDIYKSESGSYAFDYSANVYHQGGEYTRYAQAGSTYYIVVFVEGNYLQWQDINGTFTFYISAN